MPFMHSESTIIHQSALELFENLGNPINLDFEKKHKVIIDRFGRYPHRNAVLGRNINSRRIGIFNPTQFKLLTSAFGLSISLCDEPISGDEHE